MQAIPSMAQLAQQGTPPSAEANCTVTAMNRTAPLQGDFSFTIYNIPGAATAIGPENIGNTTPAPPFRVRAVCSDGTVGETDLAFPEFEGTVVYTGEIFWRPATPIPLGLALTAAQNKLSANQATQLTTTGILANATTVDLTARNKGTLYTSSNPLIATVSNEGLATVVSQFASGSAARVVMTAQNEGVAGTTVLQVGPRGRLSGKVYRADGTTPVMGAQVTIIRNQPRESLGTVTTDAGGNYVLDDVSAGAFSISVIEPSTGDLGRGAGVLETEGETSTINVNLNGQGTVNVTVLNGADAPVSNASVTFTSLTGYRDIRTVQTNASGQVVLERALAGQFTVSTRDSATNLVGTALGTLLVGGTANVTLKLQPVGAIAGVVYATDGTTVQDGIQVRLVSAVRGIVTQVVTTEDGKFRFDALPLSNGPYTLDAMQNGRLKARVPNLILTQAGQELAQNIVFAPAGMVSGVVTRSDGSAVEGATVTVQSLVGQRFAFSTKSDAQGRYMIDGVPVGAFGLTASAGGGEVGSGGGNISSDGENLQINLQLAANGIVGTVFNRDGTTPVGAGVSVTLKPGNINTQTNAQGQYGFSVSQPNTYTVEASDTNGNRGRSSVVITAIAPGDPKTLDIVFLARGTVQGSVRDPNGSVQTGVPVTLTSSSLFGGTMTANSDSQGNYRFDGVFIGEFSVYARNPATNLAGFGRGRLAENENVVTADVTLAATGSVSGKVVAQDNTTAIPGATVEFNIAGAAGLRTIADAEGNFNFPVVPLGDFSLLATNPANGDKGQVVSRLVTLNEARTVNIRMLGQGAVRVRAVDGANQPVQGVAVAVNSTSQFGGTFQGVTGSDGLVTFSPVFNGDVNVSGEKGTGISRVSGFGATTIIGGATAEVTLTLLNTPVGAVAGIVTKGLNADPQAGVTVRLNNTTTGAQRSVVTAADGAYRFYLVEVGPNYRVTALVNDRVRARSDVTISAASETVTRDLVLIGVGTVSGLVTNAQNQAQPGIFVTLTNPDPTYGGTWTVTTQADGRYSLANIPAGNFTVRARSNDGRLQAQNSGIVRFDADAVTVNLTLVDNAINLPINLYDANGARFDLQGDGSIRNGINNVFNGNAIADARASRLEIVVNGVPVPFQNGDGTIGRLTQLGQLLDVDDFHEASGLDVTRRIYVPKNGYFSRTLEVLENRSPNPITVGVRIISNMAPGVVGARVVDTSSNDSVLDVSADASRDRWAILDDERDADPFEQEGNPSVAMVFDGPDAAGKVAEAGVAAVGTVAKVSWQWSDVTIQPGASVALMHFNSQQLGRIPARAAAERLVQLPPEALEGLTLDERAIILNFKVPADGLSTLQPLPRVENSLVTGTVFAGDGTTPIAGAAVTFKSENLLFGRTYRATTNASGIFNLASQRFGQSNVIAITQDRFTATARHPHTNAVTAPAAGNFEAEQVAVQQDLIFIGTGNLTGSVKRHTGAAVTSGTVSIPYRFPGSTVTQPLTTGIDATGTFKYTGIEAGDYLATAVQSHPQGLALNGSAAGSIGVPAATTTVVAITMEETGEVTGTVRAANGEPVVGASVELDPDPYYGAYRYAQTDTGGNYRFTDVRLGDHVVRATGNNGLRESGATTVVKDTAAVVNLQLAGTGQINVQVNYQRGTFAVNAYVEVVGRTGGYTNGAGQVSFSAPSDVPLTIRARHPDNWNLIVADTATIVGNGGTAQITLALPSAGSVTGTLMRPDGSTPASGVSVTLRRQDGTVSQSTVLTNSAGVYRFNGLPVAPYSVSAEDRATFKFAYADTAITADGQEVTVNLRLADNRIALPADLRDANDFLFDIQQNGSIGAGWRARWSTTYSVYQNSGSQLEINGTLFAGDVGASLEAGRRQFAITQPTPLAGLTVTRKVFVPRGGYFARYLEVLENPGSSPVSVAVKVKSRFRNTNTSVHDTSSGDNQLQPVGAQRDTWVVMDDATDADPFLTSSQPATSLVLGPSDSTMPHDQLEMNYSSGTSLIAGWSNVTVPANGRVVLMHFQVQQINRASARYAAERLQQLPPEALDSLTNEEIAAVSNFAIPADGQSNIAALPSLLGRVSGVVYEGDGRTIVRNAPIEIRSTHPLFGRTWMRSNTSPCDTTISVPTLVSTTTGAYSLNGRLQDVGSIPLPVGSDIGVKAAQTRCYSTSGLGHPLTRVPSPTFTATFGEAANDATRDVLFDTGILTGTVAGPSDYGVGGGTVRTVMPANVNSSGTYTVAVTIANDGTYLFPGLPAGNRELTSTVPHNQGTQLLGIPLNTTVTGGQTTVADINIEPTGSLNGAVVTPNGEASVGSYISLTMSGNARSLTRSSYTDSLGRFNFSAVPVGTYTLSVTDARTAAITSAVVTVMHNQITVQNLTLVGTGSMQLTVNFARGTPAANVDVYLQSSAVNSSFYYKGRTDDQGRLTFLVPVGTYTVRVAHPIDGYYSGRWVETSGAIANNNESTAATLVLAPKAAVRVTVIDQDGGNAPIAGARITVADSGCTSGCDWGTTNGSGQLLISNVRNGNYTITARTQQGRIVSISGIVDASVDGQTLEKTMALTATADKLAGFTYTSERHLYSIAANANDVISVGVSGAVVNGGPSAYLTNVQIFSPAKARVAEGYGYDSRNNYYQYNSYGNLESTTASSAGNYTIAVNPYYSNESYLGGYRLQVRINGEAVEIPVYSDGGIVRGTITKADNTAAVGQMVQIQTDDILRLSVRTETDTTGVYQFAGVPVSGFTVSALDSVSKSVLISATDTVSAAAQVVTKDLRIPPRTTLQVQVSIPGGLSIPSQLYFQVTDMGGTRQEGPVTFASGETTSSVRTVAVYGEQVSVRVVHPNNSTISASSTITGAEGQTIPVVLTLAAAGVQGRVLNGAGEPVSGIYVRARVAVNNNLLGAMYTNSQGVYQFAALPAGEEILLQAQEPNTSVLTSLRTALELGQTITRDIQLTGVGTISGVVSRTSGGAIAGAEVIATYVYDDVNNYTTQRYAYSNAAGEYSISNLPVGREITVGTNVYTGFRTVVGTNTITLASHGQNSTVNLSLEMSGGSVFVRVLDTDNQPVPYYCRDLTIEAANGESGNMRWQRCGDGVTFDAVPAGQATITGELDYIAPLGPVTVDIVEGQRTDAVIKVSLIKGVVRFADGTPVQWPSVILTNESQTLYAESNENGEYRVYGAVAGPFTIRAEDYNWGLSATGAGNMVDPTASSITLDLTMPPTGTVTGILTDGNNQPIPNADVYVRSSAVDTDRYAYTDSNGAYRVEHMAVGTITAVARGPYPYTKIAQATGQLIEPGSVLNLDLRVERTVAVGGRVFDESGASVSGAAVSITTLRSYGPFGTVSYHTSTDANGNYNFADVPVGEVRLRAHKNGVVGFVSATVVADTPLALNVTIGGAVLLPHIFNGTDTSRYDVNCDGSLNDGGYGNRFDAYDGAYYLRVNGSDFPCNEVAPLSNADREVLLGPNLMDNLQVSRKVYVPTSGGFARYLDTFSNPAASDITVAVRIRGNLGSDSGTQLRVSPAQSGGRYAVTTDHGSDPALAHVFASAGATLTGTQTFNPPNDQFSYEWTVTVPAGGTASILHFAVQRAAGDASAAQAQAEALSTMTQTGMFEGLSSAERSNIKNFAVSP